MKALCVYLPKFLCQVCAIWKTRKKLSENKMKKDKDSFPRWTLMTSSALFGEKHSSPPCTELCCLPPASPLPSTARREIFSASCGSPGCSPLNPQSTGTLGKKHQDHGWGRGACLGVQPNVAAITSRTCPGVVPSKGTRLRQFSCQQFL